MKVSKQNHPRVGDVIEVVVTKPRRYKHYNDNSTVRLLLVLEDPDLSLFKSDDWAFCKCLNLNTNSVDFEGFDLRSDVYTIISRLK